MYDLFGKYGAIRQVRLGNDTALKTKGTAYVVSLIAFSEMVKYENTGLTGYISCSCRRFPSLVSSFATPSL